MDATISYKFTHRISKDDLPKLIGNNRLPRKGRARRGSGFHWKQLRDFKEVSE